MWSNLKSYNRLVSLLISCLVMAASGTTAAYSIFSEGLRVKFGLTFSDLNVISSMGNTAIYVTFIIVGPVFDSFGERWTMLLATVLLFGGYFLMYMTYEGFIAGGTVTLAIYYFIVGFGSAAG